MKKSVIRSDDEVFIDMENWMSVRNINPPIKMQVHIIKKKQNNLSPSLFSLLRSSSRFLRQPVTKALKFSPYLAQPGPLYAHLNGRPNGSSNGRNGTRSAIS